MKPQTIILCAIFLTVVNTPHAATTMKHYYAHDTVADKNGVIAPWYRGLNGQFDYRVRIAAETMKRYPWVDTTKAPMAAPEFIWNGMWQISPQGEITFPPLAKWKGGDFKNPYWADGDRMQRASFLIRSLLRYYQYSGDATVLGMITLAADSALNHCLTPADHPWPKFPVSIPVDGKAYDNCAPTGMIQIDVAAELGLALLRVYQLTGDKKYLEPAKHWADLLAEHCDYNADHDPWTRYANPESVPWKNDTKVEPNKMNGSVAYILYFLDELIRLGYTGKDQILIKARDAGRIYLRDKLLPKWTVQDTWGRNFWDWASHRQIEYVTNWACRYMMDHQDYFPNWRNDVRNILGLFINHTGVAPASASDTFHGAWEYPESPICCKRSLIYGSMELAWIFARYAIEAQDPWAREIARRQIIITTYDIHENGIAEDNIDGGFEVYNDWFKITHPMTMVHVLETLGLMPEELGANRENHLVRSSATVTRITYEPGKIRYSTFDAPENTFEIFRLGFIPSDISVITAEKGSPLPLQKDLSTNGYTVKPLKNGDSILTIRHDGTTDVLIQGKDTQKQTINKLLFFKFRGNQFRLLGSVSGDSGKADVTLDGVKQITGIDAWSPLSRDHQVLYYKNGLSNREHTLKISPSNTKNIYSQGVRLEVESLQYSSATGSTGFGEGGGPKDAQRMIFGYTGREDYIDSSGNTWKPATEWIVRLDRLADSVVKTWWTEPVQEPITNTKDPELYRYGAHAPEFTINLTVGPGKYHLRLKFAATRNQESRKMDVFINGKTASSGLDVLKTAGAANRALDLVFKDLKPKNGIIEVRLKGNEPSGEATLQALELVSEV